MSKRVPKMEGGALVAPQEIKIEEGHQDMLRQSHIKVDNRYFPLDPNLDFDTTTILCEDRLYTADQKPPSATAPISFTIQPQYNVFRSLSESRFVFTVQAILPATPIILVPKPYWSQLFVQDFNIEINNVSCNDQHTKTASYAGFIKILLTQGNLKVASISSFPGSTTTPVPSIYPFVELYCFAGEDTRSLQEGIVNIDSFQGEDFWGSYNNIVMNMVGGGFSKNFGSLGLIQTDPYQGLGQFNNVAIELTYRPQDGIFLQPKLLPPGVNLNFIFNLNTIGLWCNGYTAITLFTPGIELHYSTNPDSVGVSFNVLQAQYYERQYTITQSGLKAYQSLIMRQPLYYSCMTSNTLLYPVEPTQQSVQLTNVFSGRLPNIIVVGLLNRSPNVYQYNGTGNLYPFKTYSPQLPPSEILPAPAGPGITTDCIKSVRLQVNGRIYPHLWTSNMSPNSNQDLSQWYEQYRQCALISKISGRGEGLCNSNFDTKYKYDNPILTKSEFISCATFLCFNIRRNGTIMCDSGDKEVGGIDMLVDIAGTTHPGASLMVVGINTDSLATITDGGSTTSFVF